MFSRFFIERPVFAAVISIIIVLAGLVAMRALPIEQYPTIMPVQVTVNTMYAGADSQTLAESVAAPIEAQINGVDNMLYMTSSSSSTGQLTLTVFFSLDTDPDIAQVQVQNRVNLALPQLPTSVQQNGVQVQKKSSSIMMLIAVKGPAERYTSDYIANYANVYVLDALKRVQGAGQAQILGVPDQAMRIWMNPDRMASLGITTSDIQQAVQSQNALFGAGQIGQQPTQAPVELSFPVVTQRPFTDPSQYENMILRANSPGSAIVRLKDVARAEVGLKSYIVDSKLNGVPATYIAVYQQSGANALQVSDGVRAALEQMKPTFPPGIEAVIALDTTDFVRLSIKEVIKTLFEAIVLVVLVVYLFLQSFRATFICIIAVFVALVGAFSGMYALGFSLNLLTLFGLILAIGMVIDDAIVVVENVDRNMHEHGLSPKDAAIRSMEEVSGPVVAVVLVLCAVFIPAAFLPGTTGQLYKQFAITIVVSVTISGFVALTLTPAMCSLMLTKEELKTTGFFGWFNRKFQKLTDAYGRLVMLTIRRAGIALVLLAVFVGAIVALFRTTPTSFVPLEDQGYVLAAIIMPDAASLDRTVKVGDQVDRLFAESAGVLNRSVINGYSIIDQGFKTNSSTLFITLKDFEERYKSIASAKLENPRTILIDVYKKSFGINEALVLPIAPPAIPGIGTTGGFEFWIQSTGGGDPGQLDALTQQFLKAAKARPELTGLNTTFRANTQQLKVDVNRDKATLLGVQVQDVYSAIQAQFGSLIVSQFNQFSRSWFVILQSDARYRLTPEDITKLYTRNQHGRDGAADRAGHHELRDRAGPDAALQRLPGREDHRQPGAGIQLRPGDRDDGGGCAAGAAERLPVRVVGPRVRREARRRHVDGRLPVRPDLRLPGARRPVRVVDPAGCRDDRGSVRRAGSAGLQLDARARQRRVLPDRPAGADRPRRQERGAARVRGGGTAPGGQVDHGSDDARRRAAPASDHHDLAGVRIRRAAAGACTGRGCERAALDRHRHHRRHARRDDARDALRAAVLLSVRADEREARSQKRRRRPGGLTRSAEAGGSE